MNLPATPDIAEHAELLGVLRQQAGGAAMSGPTATEILRMAKLAAEKGDAVRGEAIYRQPGLACIACHAIGGAGGLVGPRSELGKPGDFGATKSREPRVWAVMPDSAAKGDPSLPWIPINGTVNGTVNGTLLAGDVAPFASGAVEILAAARVQLSETADVVLSFPQPPLGVWVDGQPVTNGRVRLEPGIHKIVVRHKAGGDLHFESSAGLSCRPGERAGPPSSGERPEARR